MTVAELARVQHKSDRKRLIDRQLEKIVAPPGRRLDIGDTIVRELRLRVSASGVRSWSVVYRVAGAGPDGLRGPMRRMTLGNYPVVTLENARTKAREALTLADSGVDPALQKREAIAERNTRAFEVIAERFIDEYAKENQKEWAATKRYLDYYVVPEWRGRAIETITRPDAIAILGTVRAKAKTEATTAAKKRKREVSEERLDLTGVSAAREVRKRLSTLFNWAADEELISTNPLAGLRRKGLRYKPRSRVLEMDELRRVWDAAGEVSYPFGTMVRLLILTLQRRSEVAELERPWFNKELQAVEIPAARYKTGHQHVYPLSAPAFAIVEELPKWNGGDYLFTTTGGERPISGFSKAKARLDEKITELGAKKGLPPIAPWTVHDLRRSGATHLARLGVPQEHIERVLGYVIAGVAGTYNHYGYLDEKRSALELWGSHLLGQQS